MSVNKKNTASIFQKKSVLIGAIIFIVIYCISMFVPGVAGYTSYPIAYIKCLGEPLGVQAGYMPDGTPINFTYNVPSGKFKYSDYVCTYADAARLDGRKHPSKQPTVKSPEEVQKCLDTPTDNGLHPTREACESDLQRSPSGHFIIDG